MSDYEAPRGRHCDVVMFCLYVSAVVFPVGPRHGVQVSLTLLEGVQAGYHTQKATRASKAVSARSPGYHGREQHRPGFVCVQVILEATRRRSRR
jgi:hypothetical protein